MIDFPLRLFFGAYTLSTGAAIAMIMSGSPFWASAFVFWVGGAFAMIGLPLVPGLGRLFMATEREDLDMHQIVLDREYAMWAADLEQERVETRVQVEDAELEDMTKQATRKAS